MKKKDIEIIIYLIIEIGLALAIKELAGLSSELTVILGAVFVFYGTKLALKLALMIKK